MVKNNPSRIFSGIDDTLEEDLVRLLTIGFRENSLTSFGRKNVKIIQKMAVDSIRDIEVKEDSAYCRKFFDKGKYYKKDNKLNCFDPGVYKNFFKSEDEYNIYLEEHNQRMKGVPKQNIMDPNYNPPILEFAARKAIGGLIRNAENELRTQRGLPMIGEGWISETELYYKIKVAYPNYSVLHHGKPKWLGLQHFDIYFPEFNIAIEYQGAQHFEEVEIFGGKEGYARTQLNDQIKREKCKNHSCTLIEVTPDHDFDNILDQINNILRDKIK